MSSACSQHEDKVNGYRHTQVGWVIIAAVAAAIAIIVAVILSTHDANPVAVAVLVLLIATVVLFHSLHVEIRDDVLTCRFGPGLIRRSIPLSAVSEMRAVRNPWYAGWGIRWMPGRYWLWNVSGLRGVELVLRDGSHFRIGSDEPEMLLAATESAMAPCA